MNAYECFKEYLSLKNHFTKDSYDYFKYNGKVRTNLSSFEKRKDKIFFHKLAKHDNVHGFLVANLAHNPKTWIKELAYSEEAEKVYKDWYKKQQSLSYLYKKEISEQLAPTFDANFKVLNDHPHPYLLRLYLGGYVTLETLCILLHLTGAKKYWDSKLEYDIVYEGVKNKIQKYTPFVKFDEEKLRKITIDYFS
jgi:hypothetical protein